ncbi:MAG: 30S ribosomal protein S6e [Thermoplasmata archaeon HGW-Thermoplasmata-1]|nr:MAG: 30S ribosomal protein S6e [Thermoplasmata archaeon HGW-Thermoplasmata-1]
MVDFKVVVSDPKDGKSYNVSVSGHHANSLIGKKIGDEVDGIFVSLPGYKLQVTGGSDKDGFAMRPDVLGISRKKLLVSDSIGFHPEDNGVRMRKTLRGNTVTLGIVQVNMKVTKHGSKAVAELLSAGKSE